MKKMTDIWISGWCIFARLLYFTIISSILLLPARAIPLILASFIKMDASVNLVINLLSLIVFTPFVCYFTFKITKLLGPQISFPIMCPKCGSFVERKDGKQE